MRRRLLVVAVVVAVVVVAAAAVVWVRGRSADTRLAAAMALAPRTAVRFSWTDWAGVRRQLGVSADEAADATGRFMSRAYDADLSSESALVSSTPTLARSFGISPANLEWELYAQGDEGAVELMGLPDDLDTAKLADTLEGLGYRRPGSADGVWTNSDLTSVGTLTPELTNLTIDTDHHVLAASDSADFLGDWRSHQRDGADGDDPIDQVVASVGDALAAAVYDGDYACQALAMSSADSADQAEGARLVEEAGKVNPLDAFAMADEPGGDARVAMAFESDDQARTNADTRSQLAVGPAPGQGGAFTDRFRLVRTEADHEVVTMTLHPLADTYVLSDLSTGPLLFATC